MNELFTNERVHEIRLEEIVTAHCIKHIYGIFILVHVHVATGAYGHIGPTHSRLPDKDSARRKTCLD